MIRWAVGLVAVSLAACALVTACTEATKYRVMRFFLDGVPEPGQVAATTIVGKDEARPGAAAALATPDPPRRLYPHTPYRENRCGGCHNIQSGELVKPLDEGLCSVCHRDVPGEVRHVHGPVAVNECSVCHHYHTAPFPQLLLQEPRATCLQCHDAADLSSGDHHQGIEQQSCIECHHPHGGQDRFFLKRSDG